MPENPSPPSALVAAMTAYQAGEIDAFERIYGLLAVRLRRYLVSLTLNVTHAEDLLQETFLQIHRVRHTYQPPRPVEPWAFGIARFVFLMDRRSRRRRPEIPGEEVFEHIAVPPQGERFADRDQLRRAVARLSEERREPVLLHHVWGFSFKEIAGMLGIREGAAKVRAHRGMEELRAELGAV